MKASRKRTVRRNIHWRWRLVDWLMRRAGFAFTENSDPARVRARENRPRNETVARLLRRRQQPLAAVENRDIPGRGAPIPVRIYRPTARQAHPLVVYFHGGGWVVGNLDSHDSVCRRIARTANAVVVAVDYRLAPEHKFPAAVEDAYDATRWAADNAAEIGATADRLCVAGDSAGGNLAAVVSQLCRDNDGPPIQAQILIYPSTDGSMSQPSIKQNAAGPILTTEAMRWFRKQYLRSSADAADPRFSPLRAASHADLPPALIITAELDPLLDDGRAYARVLRAAGTPIRYVEYEGMAHGFLSVPLFPAALDNAYARIAAAINGSGFEGVAEAPP